jgi:hypothetical protein
MTRYLAIVLALALLALPPLAGAQPTAIPPEANWTAKPPAGGSMGARRLQATSEKPRASAPRQAVQLVGPQASLPAEQSYEGAPQPGVQTSP